MPTAFYRTGRLLGFSLTVCLVALLSGCNNDDEKSQPEAAKPAQKPAESKPVRRESVELLPDNTYKRHVFNEFNQEIETHLTSPNGSESEFRHGDGKLQETVSKDKTGKLTRRRVFARDGKTMVAGLECRSDGSTTWTVEQDKNGTVTKTTYWYDGKKVFSVEIKRADGSFEQRYYRKGGSLWQKKEGRDAASQVTEQYDSAGKSSFRLRDLPDGTREVQRFHEDGKLKVRLLLQKEKSSWGDAWNTLSAEEYDKSGTRVIRKVKLDPYNQVRGTENFNDDGTRTVRVMRTGWGSRIESEEVFDKDGKSISKKDYKWDEDVSETIDRSQFEKPTLDDPASRWQNQESYPYYRYGDE